MFPNHFSCPLWHNDLEINIKSLGTSSPGRVEVDDIIQRRHVGLAMVPAGSAILDLLGIAANGRYAIKIENTLREQVLCCAGSYSSTML